MNFDLHVAVGFWTILIASFWAVSGIYFGWPRQIFQLVNSMSPVISARPPSVTVMPEDGPAGRTFARWSARAQTLDPGATLAGVAFPYSRSAPLAILMRRRSSPGYEYVDTVVFQSI